jgi:hypothetical protein
MIMRARSRVLLIAVVAAAMLLFLAAVPLQRDPAREALDRHLRLPEGAEASYPRLGLAMRSRCWLLSAPGQPDGAALFVRLPDATFGTERIISQRELRSSLALIAGRQWDVRRNGWIGSDGQVVPLAVVRERLEAASPTPLEAGLILDLLIGQMSMDAVTIPARLMRGDLPVAIRVLPFQGTRGVLLRDTGKPPYREAERRYVGCLLAFAGPGWPSEWRVGRLVVVGY